jgi:hypothetical protein
MPAGLKASRQESAEHFTAFRQTDRDSFARGAEYGHTGATGIQTPSRLGGQSLVVNGEVISEREGQRTGQTKGISRLHGAPLGAFFSVLQNQLCFKPANILSESTFDDTTIRTRKQY